jgi:hypothetical protein
VVVMNNGKAHSGSMPGRFRTRSRFGAAALLFFSVAAAQAQTYYWNPSPVIAVGGEAQKSYNWTSGQDGSGTRPASALDDDFSNAATVGTALTGTPASGTTWTNVDSVMDTASAISVSGGKLTLKGRGSDVWNSKNQYVGTFRKDITGNFDVTVKIESQTKADPWTKAGIIMFNDYSNPAAGGAFLVGVTPGHGFIVHWDSTGGVGYVDSPGGGVDSSLLVFPCWLRAVRSGSKFTGYYRTSLTAQWKQIKSIYQPQATSDATPSQIGLFVTAHSSTASTTAVFDDFTGGGDIQSPSLNLSFNSTGPRDNDNARLAANLSAASVDFTGYGGIFSFQSFTLTVKGNANFLGKKDTMNIDPGTGVLALNADTGTQALTPRLNDTLPPIVKSGAGVAQIRTNPLVAGKLTLSGGSFDLNGKSNEFAGLAASGGALGGMQIDDTLTLTGDADFSGLASFGSLGSVLIKAEGQGGKVVNFNPDGKTLGNLCLYTRPMGAGGVAIRVGGGVNVAGNLVLRNLKSSAGDGKADFASANPAVSVIGSVSREEIGPTGNSMVLLMGSGNWTVKGSADFALGGGSAGASTLILDGASAQTLTLTSGALNNVVHSGSGVLGLGAPLSCAALTQSAGSLDFNGKNLAVTGNLSVTGGGPSTFLNLGGRTLTVKGDASLAGQSGNLLGLNPVAAWTIDVTGTLAADFATVANSNASGSTGKPTSACVDGNGNTNWDFPGALTPKPAVILRDPANLSVKPGQKAVFSVSAGGAKPLAFQWRKQGDTTVISTDSLLTIASPTLADNASLYNCTVSNKDGKDTSNYGELTVNATCDSVFAVSADTVVNEDGQVSLTGTAQCASSYEWSVESGPPPRIPDPLSPTLKFNAPRITGDTVIVFDFTAYYGNTPSVKRVRVTVKDAIPDPKFTLASAVAWDGRKILAIKPILTNGPALAKFPDKPLKYSWTLSALIADTVQAGDSLVLSNAHEDGSLIVHLCVDNGGTAACEQTAVTISAPVPVLALRGGGGRVALLAGGTLVWISPALVSAHAWNGRLLWEARGNAGASRELPAPLAKALENRRAWLSVRP